MQKIRYCFRRDTPVYSTFEVEVPDGATPEQIREIGVQTLHEKDENGELDHDVAFDFSGLKLISANAGGLGKTVLELEALEVSPHDLGVEAQLYLTGQISLDEFKARARANGLEPVDESSGPTPG